MSRPKFPAERASQIQIVVCSVHSNIFRPWTQAFDHLTLPGYTKEEPKACYEEVLEINAFAFRHNTQKSPRGGSDRLESAKKAPHSMTFRIWVSN